MNSEQHDMLVRIDERVGNLSDGFANLSDRVVAVEKHQNKQDGAWKAIVMVCVAVSCVAGLIIACIA